MCGIMGYRLIKGSIDPFSPLLAVLGNAIQTRGSDSWGLVTADPTQNGLNSIFQTAGLGKLPKKLPAFLGYDQGLVHTRAATMGSVSVKNAHPWRVGPIVAAHNGQIWDPWDEIAQYPVDSLALIHRIARLAPVDDMEGYGAVTWLSLLDGCMRMSRMRSGELSVHRATHRASKSKILFWVSRLSTSSRKEIEEAGFKISDLPILSEGAVYKVRADGRLQKLRYRLDLAGRVTKSMLCATSGDARDEEVDPWDPFTSYCLHCYSWKKQGAKCCDKGGGK